MRQVSFTEFRKNAAACFNAVEQGETIRVLRHGKLIAEVVPVRAAARTLSWKRPGLMLEVDGASLSREILRERKSRRG
jgi:antitoxin (DNA-binding transcriptional repressor) of toxin-antitoxin stability system